MAAMVLEQIVLQEAAGEPEAIQEMAAILGKQDQAAAPAGEQAHRADLQHSQAAE